MGTIQSTGIFNYEKEKVMKFINIIGEIDFKELFMENLSPEFLKLFKENRNLFYSQPFIEGISYECGLFGKTKDLKKAFDIYKEAADFKYDYLCMYRMHRIFLTDYENFDLKMNEDLHRLYLYKCFAYLPYKIIYGTYYLLNKIDVAKELDVLSDEFDSGNLGNSFQFFDFLEKSKKQFNVTTNDIKLMRSTLTNYFRSSQIGKDIGILNELLEYEKGDNAYYEAQLKYCNFYLSYSGNNCDKKKIENIFNNLVKSGYYKACFDYGQFLVQEKKYDEAKSMFKKGYDNGQQFCFGDFVDLLMLTTNFKQFLTDEKIISFILKGMCLIICLEKLGLSSFFFAMYYLTKHSSFEQKIIHILHINDNLLMIFKLKILNLLIKILLKRMPLIILFYSVICCIMEYQML